MNDVITQGGESKKSIIETFAARFDADAKKMMAALKATAFRDASERIGNEEMMQLLIVANQYNLNPFTREIYAFVDRKRGVVPIVGVDGWARIINEHPQYNGAEFEVAKDKDSGDTYCTCRMYRKDRDHPTVVTEWLTECKRDTGPWNSHPLRMLRHKTLIQAARYTFGFAGIYDQDEGHRIIEAEQFEPREARPAKPDMPAGEFEAHLPKWRDQIRSGERTVAWLVKTWGTRYAFTEEQVAILEEYETEGADGELIEGSPVTDEMTDYEEIEDEDYSD